MYLDSYSADKHPPQKASAPRVYDVGDKSDSGMRRVMSQRMRTDARSDVAAFTRALVTGILCAILRIVYRCVRLHTYINKQLQACMAHNSTGVVVACRDANES